MTCSDREPVHANTQQVDAVFVVRLTVIPFSPTMRVLAKVRHNKSRGITCKSSSGYQFYQV